MELARVRYFLAVCEHGSFTLAAETCGVTQPTVTAAVLRLERDLGGKLFERSRPAKLTPFGRKLHAALENLQAAADRVSAIAERERTSPGQGRQPSADREKDLLR